MEKEQHLHIIKTYGFLRISNAIELMWGTPECDDYISKLIVDFERDNRVGFPQEVFSSILSLYSIHNGFDKLQIVKRQK